VTSETRMRGSKRRPTKPAKAKVKVKSEKGKAGQGRGHKGGGAKSSETRVRPPRSGSATVTNGPEGFVDPGEVAAESPAVQPSLSPSHSRFSISSAEEYVSRVKGAIFLGAGDSLSPSARRDSLVKLRDHIDSMISILSAESSGLGSANAVVDVVIEYDPGQAPSGAGVACPSVEDPAGRDLDGDEDAEDVVAGGGDDEDGGDNGLGDVDATEDEDEDEDATEDAS